MSLYLIPKEIPKNTFNNLSLKNSLEKNNLFPGSVWESDFNECKFDVLIISNYEYNIKLCFNI